MTLRRDNVGTLLIPPILIHDAISEPIGSEGRTNETEDARRIVASLDVCKSVSIEILEEWADKLVVHELVKDVCDLHSDNEKLKTDCESSARWPTGCTGSNV